MVPRGEINILVAETALNEKILSEENFAILVWSLLLTIIISPFAYQKVLQRSFRGKVKTGISMFTIRVRACVRSDLVVCLLCVCCGLGRRSSS